MTNKEFFLKTLESEGKLFIKVLKAVPAEHLAWKPGERGRTTQSLAAQIATQPGQMARIVKGGTIDLAKESPVPETAFEKIVPEAEKNLEELKSAVSAATDEDWENGAAAMIFDGGKWEAKKSEMVWGFLFDLIHHRGQLTTYLRAMGAKVPAVYGPSGDEA